MTAPSEQALLRSPHFLPQIEHRGEAMRLLVPEPPAWDELASLFMRDPVLLHAVLEAAPLPAWLRLASTLRDEVSQRLQTLGAGLLRGWLLRLPAGIAGGSDGAAAAGGEALLVAECALHLAHETRYRYPDEAYLAGLWHRLGGGAVERCGLAGPLADAVAFEPALAESYQSAHPLLRLLHVARELARPGWEERAAQLAPLCGLSRETLLSLRADVGFIVRQTGALPKQGGGDHAAWPVTGTARGEGFDPVLDVALSALVQGAFRDLEAPRVAERLEMALRLFCGEDAVVVLVADEHGILAPLPLSAGAGVADAYVELRQRLEDETSVVALAARSCTATSYFLHGAAAARSAHDWQLARWLGREGFGCLPLPLGNSVGAAVVPADEHRSPSAAARRLLIELTAAAARALLEIRERQQLRAEAEARVAARHRDHARRIAHEARNPLTVIKSYLGLIAQRPGASGLASEMDALNGELDRIEDLLQQAGEVPTSAPEPVSCLVPELLLELRTLYGESLFASRGIHFELRAATGLPAAAIPGSALRQVLLNLFRNASEALQPGGRFSVTVPGQVLSNGVPCLEIRLIDNGPGLPADRLADLFSPRPSVKGDGHGGLGLSIVREIVQQWNGFILCRSQSGSGTSFQLLLPLDKYH